MKKQSNRIEKINSLLAQELATLIRNLNFSDRLVTVLDVETTRDLNEAKVWLGVVYYNEITEESKQKEEQKLIRLLEAKSTELRQALGKKLDLRKIPFLIYKIDKNPEKADKIESLLDSIK